MQPGEEKLIATITPGGAPAIRRDGLALEGAPSLPKRPMSDPVAIGSAPAKGLGSTGSSTFNRLWPPEGPQRVNVPGSPTPRICRMAFRSSAASAATARPRGRLFVESLVPRGRDGGN